MEDLREELRFAIEGIIVDSANRISKIANCSNNIRGSLVRELRVNARKIQAGSLQLASIIKETGVTNAETKGSQEMQEKVVELERENKSLKKCIQELKEQMKIEKCTRVMTLRTEREFKKWKKR